MDDFSNLLPDFKYGSGRITVLTGAGISAESGIPTFRGPEGYWTVGSKEYHPQEMATYRMFTIQPDEVWKWYLYRIEVCRKAEPNPGHLAIAEMERLFPERFKLITQNVDGLHLRAGNTPENTYQIHGNVSYMRCAEECSHTLYPIPEELYDREKGADITEKETELLKCPRCGARSRPHVLWFDETYDERFFRFESSLRVASATDLLLVVGTSGATNLPNRVVWEVFSRGGVIVDINIEDNTFSEIAKRSEMGGVIRKPSGTAIPELLDVLKG